MITAANTKIREDEPEELKALLESLDLAVTQLQKAHNSCSKDLAVILPTRNVKLLDGN